MTSKQILEVLVEAKKLLEAGWTKEVYARGPDGVNASFMDPDACSFCAIGAVYRAAEDKEKDVPFPTDLSEQVGDYLNNAWMQLFRNDPALCLSEWNDRKTTTKEDVLNFYSRVIEKLSQQVSQP
jgi:hypothetical protein